MSRHSRHQPQRRKHRQEQGQILFMGTWQPSPQWSFWTPRLTIRPKDPHLGGHTPSPRTQGTQGCRYRDHLHAALRRKATVNPRKERTLVWTPVSRRPMAPEEQQDSLEQESSSSSLDEAVAGTSATSPLMNNRTHQQQLRRVAMNQGLQMKRCGSRRPR